MAISRVTMTDEQRKSVALEYLKAFDNKGVTSSGGSILDLFADDAQVFFPKWGLATGKPQIAQLFTDFSGLLRHILHDYGSFNWVMTGGDVFACEGYAAHLTASGALVHPRRPLVRRLRGADSSSSAASSISGSRRWPRQRAVRCHNARIRRRRWAKVVFPIGRRMHPMWLLLLTLTVAAAAAPARAEVNDATAQGFTTENVEVVAAPPDRVWAALVREVNAWWPRGHTWWPVSASSV
jgi:hypothetical protein